MGRRYSWSMKVLFVFAVFFILTGCSKGDDNIPANEVWMQNNDYRPSTITIGRNTTVTWRNKDGTNHTVTSDDGFFSSGNINNNGTYTFTFDSTGTYQYHCTIHPGMNGVVIVQ
jgi:plastocyanin